MVTGLDVASDNFPARLVTVFLATASFCLLVAAASIPQWYRDDWIWLSPVQAVLGGATAVGATMAATLVTVRTWQRRVRPMLAVALVLLLTIVAAVGGLAFVRSGAIAPLPKVELLR